jgi:hypothetical protein
MLPSTFRLAAGGRAARKLSPRPAAFARKPATSGRPVGGHRLECPETSGRCPASACGGRRCRCQGLCSQPGQCALGTAGVKALRPLRGGLRPAWTQAAAQRRMRLPEAKENEHRESLLGKHAVPRSVVSEVSNHRRQRKGNGVRSSRLWGKLLGCENTVVEDADWQEEDSGDGSGRRCGSLCMFARISGSRTGAVSAGGNGPVMTMGRVGAAGGPWTWARCARTWRPMRRGCRARSTG